MYWRRLWSRIGNGCEEQGNRVKPGPSVAAHLLASLTVDLRPRLYNLLRLRILIPLLAPRASVRTADHFSLAACGLREHFIDLCPDVVGAKLTKRCTLHPAPSPALTVCLCVSGKERRMQDRRLFSYRKQCFRHHSPISERARCPGCSHIPKALLEQTATLPK